MTTFGFTNIAAPVNAAVVATLYALDDVTVIATLSLTATSSGAATYSGSMTVTPTPPDSTTAPYTFRMVATTTAGGTVTRDIFPAGTAYGWLYGGNWFAGSDQAAPDANSYLTVTAADAIAATLLSTLVASYLAAATGDKTAALQAATLDIDAATRWQGRKFDPAQVLEFPRVAYESAGRVRPGGVGAFSLPPSWGDSVWDWDAVNLVAIVPPKVLTACVYQANYLLSGAGSRLDDIHSGLSAQSNMGLSETYDLAAPGVDTNLCLRAWQQLKKYQLSSGRML